MNLGAAWFYTYVLPLLPAILTIAGWYFVYWRENKKNTNERKYKRIDEAVRLVAEIERTSIAYYGVPAEDEEPVAEDIKFNLKRLAKICAKISTSINITDFRIAVSGGDFQSKNRKARKVSDSKMYQIRSAAFELSLKLDNYYDEINP